jgi:hypothetical protein
MNYFMYPVQSGHKNGWDIQLSKNNVILDVMMKYTQFKENFKVELNISLWVSNNQEMFTLLIKINDGLFIF